METTAINRDSGEQAEGGREGQGILAHGHAQMDAEKQPASRTKYREEVRRASINTIGEKSLHVIFEFLRCDIDTNNDSGLIALSCMLQTCRQMYIAVRNLPVMEHVNTGPFHLPATIKFYERVTAAWSTTREYAPRKLRGAVLDNVYYWSRIGGVYWELGEYDGLKALVSTYKAMKAKGTINTCFSDLRVAVSVGEGNTLFERDPMFIEAIAHLYGFTINGEFSLSCPKMLSADARADATAEAADSIAVADIEADGTSTTTTSTNTNTTATASDCISETKEEEAEEEEADDDDDDEGGDEDDSGSNSSSQAQGSLTLLQALGNIKEVDLMLGDVTRFKEEQLTNLFQSKIWASFFFSPTLRSVAPFSGIESLTLCNCPNITDISSLAPVRHVALDMFPKLSNISPLRNAATVSIRRCPNVRDISSLANVHELFIDSIETISLEKLLSITRDHIHQPFVVAAALREVSKTAPYGLTVDVSLFYSVMRRYHGQACLQFLCLNSLRTCFRFSAVKVVKTGGVDLVTAAMQRFPHSFEVIIAAVLLLDTVFTFPGTHRYMEQHQGEHDFAATITAVIAALERFPDRAEVHNGAVGFLGEISVDNPAVQNFIVEKGGIQQILAVCAVVGDNSSLAANAVFALINICFLQPAIQRRLIELTIDEVIMPLMVTHHTSTPLKVNVALLLGILTAEDPKIPERTNGGYLGINFAEIIVDALRSFPEEVNLRPKACVALANLALHVPQLRRDAEFVTDFCLQISLAVMRSINSKLLPTLAAEAIANILIDLPSDAKSAYTAVMRPNVRAALVAMKEASLLTEQQKQLLNVLELSSDAF